MYPILNQLINIKKMSQGPTNHNKITTNTLLTQQN